MEFKVRELIKRQSMINLKLNAWTFAQITLKNGQEGAG